MKNASVVLAITALTFGCAKSHAQYGPPVCNVSNSQVNGYVLTATSTGGHLCAWQAGGGGGGAVSSVFGRTGAVVAVSGDYAVGQVTGAAPLASPALTGNPTAPTQTGSDNSTKIATTAFVQALVGSGGCPTCFLGTPTNHGVIVSSATQTASVTTAGIVGQAFVSGGSGADGAYTPLDLSGGANVFIGILPAANMPTASNVARGVVQGDGSTITISSGVESCTTATNSQLGCSRPDGTSITISAGVITAHLSGGAISGTLTSGKIPLANGTSSITDSGLSDNGTFLFTAEPLQLTSSASNALAVTGGITVGGTGVFTNGVKALLYQIGSTTIIDTGGNIVNAGTGSFSGVVGIGGTLTANGIVNNGGEAAVGAITSQNSFNCTSPCTGYKVGGTITINSSRQFIGADVTTTGNVNVGGTLNVTGPSLQAGASFSGNVGVIGTLIVTGGSFFNGGFAASGGSWASSVGNLYNNGDIGARAATFTNTVTLSGLTAGSGGSPVCISANILYSGGCGGGTITAPAVVGTLSFNSANPLTVESAGSYNHTGTASALVSLMGTGATSENTVYGYFHPASEGFFREGAVVGGTISTAGNTNSETNGVIGMVVAKNAATYPSGTVIGSVAGSFFAASAVSGGVVWAENLLVQDVNRTLTTCTGQYLNACHYPSTLIGTEIDLNVWDTGSNASGINLGIQFPNGHTTALTHAIVINQEGGGSINYFDFGIKSVDAATNVFAYIGKGLPALGANSQFVEFVSGTSSQFLAKLYTSTAGYFVINPASATNSNYLAVGPNGDTILSGGSLSTTAGDITVNSITSNGISLNAISTAPLRLWTTDSNSANRNWNIQNRFACYGCLEFRVSNAIGGDPNVSGTAAGFFDSTGNLTVSGFLSANALTSASGIIGSGSIQTSSATSNAFYAPSGGITANGYYTAVSSPIIDSSGNVFINSSSLLETFRGASNTAQQPIHFCVGTVPTCNNSTVGYWDMGFNTSNQFVLRSDGPFETFHITSSGAAVFATSVTSGNGSFTGTLTSGNHITANGYIANPTMPTSCGGFPSGTLWNSSGDVRICP